jgi:Uma2 family endonuclease
MIAAGVFPAGAHVELLGGILVDKMTQNDPHDASVAQLAEKLREILPAGWVVREEKSVVLGAYERPEPDIAVARGAQLDYFGRAPRASDLALVVEVADTSYAKDRGTRWRRYANARIPHYGVVNLPARLVAVFSLPAGKGRTAAYRNSVSIGFDDEVSFVIEGREVGRVAVKEFLQ